MDICFVPQTGGYAQVVAEIAPADAGGEIRDVQGNVLGRHDAYYQYTVGQRRGLGIAAEKPKYVLNVIPESRIVVVGDEAELLAPGLIAGDINWVAMAPTPEPFRGEAFIRYGKLGIPSTIVCNDENEFVVRFDTPAPAVSPGQALVIYDGDTVIAGGWIRRRLAA